jgi:hypothetical protein
MVRIDGTATGGRIDWNADGRGPDQTPQDINFSGTVTPLNDGFDDWANIRLNQIGARRNVGALYLDDDVETVGPLSLDAGRGDLGRGDLGRGDLGRGDLGRGDLGRGDLGRGDLGRGDLGQVLTLGRGDLGRGDLGRGDLGVGADDEPIGDLDFETAAALGDAPSGLTAVQVKNGVQLSWQPPNLGGVFKYLIYRVDGATVTASSEIKQVGVVVATAPGQAPALTKIDNRAKRGVLYTYFVIAEYDDGPPRTQSGPSNFVTIMGK